ncbi:MAG: hypothetical protein NTZ05_04480 [Chloroflexi bacterium]|nr:hypothetical protein [Chloroflexota bacterium]
MRIGKISAEYHWTFDAVNGGFVTDTVRGLNGTVSNASIQGAAQVGNGALAITGADNSFVSFPKAYPGLEGYFRTPSFTIAFWVKTSSTTPVMDLVGNRRSAGCESYVQLRMRGHHPQGNDGGIYANISQDQSCTGAIEVSSKGHAYNDGA